MGEDYARQAATELSEIDVATGVADPTDSTPFVSVAVTCVAPRGRAYLVDVERNGQWAHDGCDGEEIPEPVTDVNLSGQFYADAHEALDMLNAAADGDSNDAEIEAGRNVADLLQMALSMLGHPYQGGN